MEYIYDEKAEFLPSPLLHSIYIWIFQNIFI